jgi:hypothetical protein
MWNILLFSRFANTEIKQGNAGGRFNSNKYPLSKENAELILCLSTTYPRYNRRVETNNHVKIKIKFGTVPKHYNIVANGGIRI